MSIDPGADWSIAAKNMGLLLLAVIFILPAGALLAHSTLQPLDDLLRATERLKRGDFESRVPELSGDEYGDELLRRVAGHKPDVAVVDIRMPPTGTDEGLRAAEELGRLSPSVGVLLLSEYLDPEYAMRLVETGPPGRGYL